MDPFGYTGEVLRVDLENEKITIEKPGEPYYKRYLGGRGMIMHTPAHRSSAPYRSFRP